MLDEKADCFDLDIEDVVEEIIHEAYFHFVVVVGERSDERDDKLRLLVKTKIKDLISSYSRNRE